ncbi:MAG TPA: Hpt domain-containing protein, partial [Ktedonobacterales bacterium]
MADNFDKSAILDSFIDEVSAYLPEIEANLDRLQQSPGDMSALEETYRRAHTIGGSAAMMDFGALAHVAQGMEEILGDALDNQRALDAPTIALLRRSYGRLGRLLQAIRSGQEDAAIADEDDADRSAWRGPNASGAGLPGMSGSASSAGAPPPSAPGNTGGLHIPEWLAAFAHSGPNGQATGAGPAVAGQGGTGTQPVPPPSSASAPPAARPDAWSASISEMPTGENPAVPGGGAGPGASMPGASGAWARSGQFPQGGPGMPEGGSGQMPSMSDMLHAFQASPGASAAPDSGRNGNAGGGDGAAGSHDRWGAPASPGFDVSSAGTEVMPAMPYGEPRGPRAPSQMPDWGASTAGQGPDQERATWEHPTMFMPPGASAGAPAPGQSAGTAESPGQALAALDEVRVDADAVRRQVASLRDVVGTLREAAQTMEDERTELRSFLDGSQDSLNRLEEWAGQQMGLDLRNSPEHVRHYLPLSVIWVTTTRLKKLVALLHNSGRNLTATQEQIDETLGELRTALDSFGRLYTTVASVGGAPDQGFSATVAQLRYAPPAPSVTPPSAQEAVSPGTRAEIERQVREELRRELEDDVREELAAEVRRDEEQRIRHELEIQVRRQLLAELAPGLGASAITVSGGPQPMARMPLADQAPRPIQVTSEQSPEALEVFRDEAQEHLQTITTGITQLERVPGDADALRSIRRAMHTLKGAAGMMGFSVIQDLAHASEDLLDALNDGAVRFSPDVFSVIFDTSEVLDQLVSGRIASQEEQRRATQPLIQRYAALTGTAISSTSSPRGISAPAAGALRTTIEGDEVAGERAPSHPDLSVRLQLSKLDELVTIFGELLISRS